MRTKLAAILALLFTAAAWGATFVIVKEAISRIHPELFIFVRFLLAGLMLFLVGLARGEIRKTTLRDGALLGLALGGGYWLQTRGLLSVTPARSAFLTGLAVVLAPLADHLFFKKRIPLRAAAGAVIALLGTVMITEGWRDRPSPGDLLTLLCAGTFAVHLVLTSRFARRNAPVGLAAIQVLFVALMVAPIAAVQPRTLLWSRPIVVTILVTALVTTALAMLLMVWAQARLSATEAAIVLSFEPVAAAITSVAFEGERMTASLIVGGSLILAAMLISQTGTLRADGTPADPGHE